MESLWETLGRGRSEVLARGVAVLTRTRDTGVEILDRAERRAESWRFQVAHRRANLNGKPIERVERRVLGRVEHWLEAMGLRLREQRKRLAPNASAPIADDVAEAEITPILADVAAPPARRKKRVRIEVRDVPVAPARTSARKTEKQRPAARAAKKSGAKASTRWVRPPLEVGELAALPVRQLLGKLGTLEAAELRTLLEHERANRKRKTVIDAISARLPA
jgi:hypothetical protein